MSDRTEDIAAQVRKAAEAKQAIIIRGGNTKYFVGRQAVDREPQPGAAEIVSLQQHEGIINYDPTELVVSVRAGTRLEELQKLLAESGQMLPFEPPGFGPEATIGGTVACNLSGPRRVQAGAARDYVLGMKVINGKGEVLQFGGEVMKNVAGYDVSRLMTGAMGTLGVILEVSLKVLPVPGDARTVVLETGLDDALEKLQQIGRTPAPMTASAWLDDCLYIRYEGAQTAVEQAVRTTGGETGSRAEKFWQSIREQNHAWFRADKPLWRMSVRPSASPFKLPGKELVEWGGALRWYQGDASVDQLRELARRHGGHASCFRDPGGEVAARDERLQPLGNGLQPIHAALKNAFDPDGLFNPGRYYV